MNSLALMEVFEIEKRIVKNKTRELEKIDFDYEEDHRGIFLFRLRAKMRNKIYLLAARDYCPETSIKRVFRQLKKIIQKNRAHHPIQ